MWANLTLLILTVTFLFLLPRNCKIFVKNLDFYLINLALSEREADIETIFKAHIKEKQRRKFLRTTWETIYEYISKNPYKDTVTMTSYFKNKTLGYDGNGRLQRAFSVP